MTGDVSGDLTGRRLGHYRIDSVLGKGGMSVTYQATDVRLGRKVALKVIGDHLGTDAEFRERFVDEARNTSAIDHANVVPLYDFGELDGMLYIAMRMVDGGDLAGLISGGPIAPARALTLLDQVADALDTLHSHGLVHLDVKPANVLVTSRETSREHVYVADFGLTRRGATGHRTRGGDFLGSPTYAAPEHLRGEPLDGRTDQYALTCVLFACLTGNPPFRGDVPTVIKGHLAGEPPSVSLAVALPSALDEVVRKGMAKAPADRYPSCVAMIEAARVALGPLAASVTAPGQGGPGGIGAGGFAAANGSGNPGNPAGLGNSAVPGGGPDAQGTPAGQVYPAGQGNPASGNPADQNNPVAPGTFASPGNPAAQANPVGPGNPAVGGPGTWGAPPGPGGYGAPAAYGAPGGLAQPGYSGMPGGYGTGYPAQQNPAGHPSYGYPGQPQQSPGYGYPNQVYGDPVRVRPPSPVAGDEAFQPAGRGGGLKWLWIVLGVVVAAGLVIGAILLFGGDDSGGSSTPTSTAPNIPVGPGGQGSTGPSSLRPPPSSIPIQPSR
ncbi:serine/threonine-protein kinase [Amycolatopsis sulphurea]|uniref:non-specific serine/threonine protein kinase n=1 Tax=Amycolatopsis sulphurea TaxID=76022 RepID=A0A2A9FC72_9PSEU|nr:serine/threonine-protein kinase [Amycolatopsis sulphurea]PFG48964.1 serine/threonine-protein kinase [Amycolatopsis sulphurea]